MKLFKRISALALGVLLSVTCLAACGDPKDPEDPNKGSGGPYTVTFDANLDGTGFKATDVTTVPAQTVKAGEKATYRPIVLKGSPANPDNYGFRYWATDKEGKKEYDFDSAVNSDLTLYANWEKRYVITYYGFTNPLTGVALDVSENVFKGEKAPREDGYADSQWKKIEGYYKDAAKTQAYDFNAPVIDNISIYAKLGTGFYLSAGAIKALNNNGYGRPSEKFEPDAYVEKFGEDARKAAKDETTVEIVGTTYEEQYAKVHFGAHMNASWLSANTVSFLKDPATGARDADTMTIRYKNLGPAPTFRFYYVVGYEAGAGSGTYEHSGGGGWGPSMFIDVQVSTNMKETDEWKSFTIDLVKGTERQAIPSDALHGLDLTKKYYNESREEVKIALDAATRKVTVTKADGTAFKDEKGNDIGMGLKLFDAQGQPVKFSEWGNADVLEIPRWEFIDTYDDPGTPYKKGYNPFLNNTVLIKDIVFSAKEA